MNRREAHEEMRAAIQQCGYTIASSSLNREVFGWSYSAVMERDGRLVSSTNHAMTLRRLVKLLRRTYARPVY